LGELHWKSCIRFIPDIEKFGIEVLGSVNYSRGVLKSRVRETLVCGVLCDNECSAPFLGRGYDDDGVWKDGLALAKLDQCMRSTDFTYDMLVRAADCYLSRCPLTVGLGVMSEHDVINGVDGCRFIDAMRMDTSVGLPFKGPKLRFFRGEAGKRKLGLELALMVDRMEECYLRGESFNIVFDETLKDEVVSKKKRRQGKARAFYVAQAAFIYLQKKYFGTIVKFMQENGLNFEMAIGVDTKSSEWRVFYDFITAFKKFMANDFKKFDKSLAAVLILMAFYVLICIAKQSGRYDSDDIKVMWGIAFDVAFPLVSSGGDLIRINGSSPSGHALTVIVNSVCVSLMLRFAFYTLYPGLDFNDHVHLLTYGDDNMMGVSDSVPLFDNYNVQRILVSVGISIVPADKDNPEYDSSYTPFEDVTFLKRKFVEYRGRMCCPIDMATIRKLFSMYVDEGSLSPQDHTFIVCDEALHELVQHGEEVYSYWEPRVKDALHLAGIDRELVGFHQRWDLLGAKY
jgi:hypothetical protein